MVVIGRGITINSSVVKNPPRLPGLTSGTLTITDGLEENPTATIAMEGVMADDIQDIRNAYVLGTEYDINGMKFRVSNYGDVRHEIPALLQQQTGASDAYRVRVTLEGYWGIQAEQNVKQQQFTGSNPNRIAVPVALSKIAEATNVKLNYPGGNVYLEDGGDRISVADVLAEVARIKGCYFRYGDSDGIRVQELGSSKIWSVNADQVIDEGSAAQEAPPAYRGATLEWRRGNVPNPPTPDVLDRIEPIPIVEDSLTEEDDNIGQPGGGIQTLRSIQENADLGGSSYTKTKKVSRYVNGVRVSEEITIYGFAYIANDIWTGETLEGSAGPHWKPIEFQKTSFEYQNISSSPTYPATFKDEETGEDLRVYYDTENFRATNVSYLVKSTTTGWKLVRWTPERNRETTEPQTDPLELALQECYKFFRMPLNVVTTYTLEPERNYYDNVELPVEIEIADWSQLSQRLQKATISFVSTRTGRVAIGRPKLNFVEPMLVMKEVREGRNVQTKDNPVGPDAALEKGLPPVFVTGKNEYFMAERFVPTFFQVQFQGQEAQDKYTERTKEYSAQDAGFDSSLIVERTAEKFGRPPKAETLLIPYRVIPGQGGNSNNQTKTPGKYKISSDLQNYKTKSGGSLTYEHAISLSEALLAAQTELRIAHLQSQRLSHKLSWYYPLMRAGDRLRIPGRGIYTIMRVTNNLRYDGTNNPMSQNGLASCVAEGTDVDLAVAADRVVYHVLEA